VPVKPEQLARAQVIPHPLVSPTPRAELAGNPPAHPPVPAQRPAIVQQAPGRGREPSTTARNVEPNARTLPPHPETNTAEAPRSGVLPPTERANQISAPHPLGNPAPVSRGVPAPIRQPLVSKYPAPAPTMSFAQRAPVMAVHPGRPLEPQQIQNMYARRPPGPMIDHEFPPHAAPLVHAAPAAASHAAPPRH
jgi:hypothetical protein